MKSLLIIALTVLALSIVGYYCPQRAWLYLIVGSAVYTVFHVFGWCCYEWGQRNLPTKK